MATKSTNAQRQAAYREKHLGADGLGERLNLIVDAHCKAALKRLASCYGVTQKAMLERLVAAAERVAVERAGAQDSDYYDCKLKFEGSATEEKIRINQAIQDEREQEMIDMRAKTRALLNKPRVYVTA